jgi:quercetin dioxygenase-like cupin family protein
VTGETLKLTPHESLTVRQRTPEVLEVEARLTPGKPPPAHYHPRHDEQFEVLEGTLQGRVGGEEKVLRQGDTLSIPRGAVHQMWNPGAEVTRVSWKSLPAGRTYEWFAAIDSLQRQGRVRKNGLPGPLALGVLLTEYRDVIRPAVKPRPLVMVALVPLALMGRVRGYRP